MLSMQNHFNVTSHAFWCRYFDFLIYWSITLYCFVLISFSFIQICEVCVLFLFASQNSVNYEQYILFYCLFALLMNLISVISVVHLVEIVGCFGSLQAVWRALFSLVPRRSSSLEFFPHSFVITLTNQIFVHSVYTISPSWSILPQNILNGTYN